MNPEKTFLNVRFLYFGRVALITLVLVGAFGPFSFHVMPSLLGGVLDVDGSFLAFYVVSLATFLVQGSAWTTLRLLAAYGPERFQDLGTVKLNDDQQVKLRWQIFAVSTVPSLALLIYVSFATDSGIVSNVVAGGLAFTTFLLIYWGGEWWRQKVSVQRTAAAAASGLPKGPIDRLAFFFVQTLQPLGKGYLFTHPRTQRSHVNTGHILAVILFFLSGLVYVLFGQLERAVLTKDNPSDFLRFVAGIPPLTYLLFALMLACWFFSGVTFFLDRYRVPTLTIVLAACLVTSAAPESDHFFRVRTTSTVYRGETPAQILRRHRKPSILIAAEGGGIQAAVWTAKAIAMLDEKFGPDFRSRIAVISGVSGGAVGAMHVGARFADLQLAPRLAEQSSLQEVAWGWTNPDIWRAILPWFGNRRMDRGWALERSWEQRLGLSTTFASDWAQRTKEGFPAFIFNMTWVETGQPVVLSTTNFPKSKTMGLTAFHDLWPDFDIRISTAARLSASFPFVSPAARPDGFAISYADSHLVDGGYYDNFGLYSLIAWLNEAIKDPDYLGPSEILLLQIRSFPEVLEPRPAFGRTRQGWFAQTHAPLDTMLHTRTAGQLRQAQALSRYFVESVNPGFSVSAVDLSYYPPGDDDNNPSCDQPPLSWKLTAAQKSCIANATFREQAKKLTCIEDFLRSGTLTEGALSCWTIQ